MDERLAKALEFANYSATLFQERHTLKLKFDNAVRYTFNGGVFIASHELIGYLDVLCRRGDKGTIMLDHSGLPVRIENLKEFSATIQSVYQEALNDYYISWEKLRRGARSVKTLVGLK